MTAVDSSLLATAVKDLLQTLLVETQSGVKVFAARDGGELADRVVH
jgi:hypothetical protein